MDGYYGSGIDVLSVPQDQEPSDRLPSPNSWSQWGILRPGSWEENMLMDANDDIRACGVQLDIPREDCRFDVYRDLLNKYHPIYVEEDTADDFFYKNSLLSGFHSSENDRKHDPFCFCPQCDHDDFPAGDSWLDIINSPGLSKSTEKLVELGKQSLLASRDLNDGGSENLTVPTNMKDYQLLEDSPSPIGTIVPSRQFGPYYQVNSETSPEELALEELKLVTTLLSDQTRICFRDALYRLADNSKRRPKRSAGQERGSSIRNPLLWTDKRSSKESNESNTNVIDRAVANIMFNRMDSNSQEDHSESAQADLDLVSLCAGETHSSGSNLPLVCHDESEFQLSHDFEVPVVV